MTLWQNGANHRSGCYPVKGSNERCTQFESLPPIGRLNENWERNGLAEKREAKNGIVKSASLLKSE